jgi:hypothetical protein
MHSLIVGITESGKTTLAKKLAQKHIGQGFSVLVLTSVFDEWPDGVQVFDDEEYFLEVFWASQKCVVFIDEGGETIGRFNKGMEQTATKGRHFGHSCYFMGQRATLINATVRGQCGQLFCFQQGAKDSDVLAEEWSQPKLKEATMLKRGECFVVRRFGADGGKFIAKLNAFENSKGENQNE